MILFVNIRRNLKVGFPTALLADRHDFITFNGLIDLPVCNAAGALFILVRSDLIKRNR
jgi:hypothetical protein